ncbi:RlpA-like double-psi beta-barrel-protein domain-containing protein-containing protein [Geopyxis carbonaria]|nr:RlpA-like double-psi beta-barrel-protein domain-containing protein-containing protein [Geopyxis carbonaria]
MQFQSIISILFLCLLGFAVSAPVAEPAAEALALAEASPAAEAAALPEAEESDDTTEIQGDTTPRAGLLVKRGFRGQATYYTPGLGACGKYHNSGQHVAAVAVGRGKGECGRRVKIQRGGRSCIVTIVDLCQGCAYGDIDLSITAFKKVAKQSEGRVPIKWWYI